MSAALPDDVRAALVAGRKLDAIRLLRQQTGLGLAEAKAAVETGRLPAAAPVDRGWEMPVEAQRALEQGKVVQAIRLLRSTKGGGLKDAKAMVDAARGMPASPAVRQPSGLAPGEVPRSRFGGGLVIVLLVIAVVIWLSRTA